MQDPILSAKIRKFRKLVLGWYKEYGRDFPWRRAKEPFFRLVITEILLQRTRAETVSRHYQWFFHKFSTWEDIANAPISELEDSLRSLGLWKERAEVLSRLSNEVMCLGGELPIDRQELERLPGFGQYVVNATQAIRGLERAPLLDASMARLLERVFGPRKLADIRYDPYLQELAWQVTDCPESIKASWALLDFAAVLCRPSNPRCVLCPVRSMCRAHARKGSAKRM